MAKPKSKAASGEGSFSEFLAWMGISDPAERNELACQVASANLTEHKGIASLASTMIAGLVSGQVPPGVASEARHWAELMLTANLTQKSLEGGGKSAVTVLLESKTELEHSLEAAYTTVVEPLPLIIDGKQ
jgi:hypothetical protein